MKNSYDELSARSSSINECIQPSPRAHICFVALNAYSVLSGQEDISRAGGGAEVQQMRIASWLVRQGYTVSCVTLDHGQADGIGIHGIRVYRAYAPTAGIQGLRFFHPRWSSLWAAMSRADADIYYQRNAEPETGQVALWCRLHRRKFIFAAAAHSNCDLQLLARKPWRERTLYRLGIRLADVVTAQTAVQQLLFQRNFGLASVLVRNCGPILDDYNIPEQMADLQAGVIRVLWVGRISKEKRFEWLLDVAERCPDVTFEVIGAPSVASIYSDSLTRRASTLSNVTMHGGVPHAEISKYYHGVHVLCCTSPCEGFPNTFLEAWAHGIPVVSTFDPDGVIAANGLGWVVHDVDGIVNCLRRVIATSTIWSVASRAATQYYVLNHTPDVCLEVLERLIQRVTEEQNHR